MPSLELRDLIAIPREDYITKLKESFSKSLEKDEVLFTSEGRNAIYLALKTMDLKKKDEVLMPGYVCDAVQESIKQICRPVHVDINARTFNMDPDQIEANITKNSKAILISHLYGNPCDMGAITDIAYDRNLILIEDVAQALNGKYDGKILGSFGDIAILSFRFTKDITSFKGGALLANKKIDFESRYASSFQSSAKIFITLGAMKQIRKLPSMVYAPLKKHILFPYFKESASKINLNNTTLSNYQCYLLYQQLKNIDNIIIKRRKNAKFFSKELENAVLIPEETKFGEHTYYRYTIQTDKRDELLNYLLNHGVEADKMYDYHLAPLPNSMIVSKNNLNIPIHHDLTQEDLNKVVDVIHEFK